MASEIAISESAEAALQAFPAAQRRIILEKVRLLINDRKHPSLKVHKVARAKARSDIWECYITDGLRMLFEFKEHVLHIWGLGNHAIVDKVQYKSFAANTRFNRLATIDEQTSQEIEEPRIAIPQWISAFTPGVSQETEVPPVTGTPNYFTFFQIAHLRILGVPSRLVKPLKEAPTLEQALELPGLPAQTQAWLMELSTAPQMETILADSTRLLYRTTLDHLEGYCEGRIKRLMLNLQRPEQQRYIEMDNSIILLKGVAGSGKTTIGIYRAIRFYEQGQKVLIVTYNKTLASATRALLKELLGMLPEQIQVKTLHSFLMEILRKRYTRLRIADENILNQYMTTALQEVRKKNTAQVLQRDETFFKEEIHRVIKGLGLTTLEEYKTVERLGRKNALGAAQRAAVWQVYQIYQQQLNKTELYDWTDVAPLALRTIQERSFPLAFDHIIIDEAQDLAAIDLKVLQRLLFNPEATLLGKKSMMILADAAQTLYSRGFSWKQAGIQARGNTAILKKNYRNTYQVAEAAAHLLTKNTLLQSTNEYINPEWTQRQGSPPLLIRARDNYDQIIQVRERLLDLVSDQSFRLSDFTILCPTNKLCEQCQKELESAGLRTLLHKDEDFDLLEERIKIMTVHSAKGLEFPVVFFVGLVQGVLPSTNGFKHVDPEDTQLYIEQQRTICYVGMTRAAEALYLVTVRDKESPFLQELSGKMKEWK